MKAYRIYHKELDRWLQVTDGPGWKVHTNNIFQEEFILEFFSTSPNLTSQYHSTILIICGMMVDTHDSWDNVCAVPLDERGNPDFRWAMEMAV